MAEHWEWLGHSEGKRRREFLNLISKVYVGEFPTEGSSVVDVIPLEEDPQLLNVVLRVTDDWAQSAALNPVLHTCLGTLRLNQTLKGSPERDDLDRDLLAIDLECQLRELGFYVGYMEGQQCNIALSKYPPGTYLLRRTKKDNFLRLSYVTEERNKKDIKHLQLKGKGREDANKIIADISKLDGPEYPFPYSPFKGDESEGDESEGDESGGEEEGPTCFEYGNHISDSDDNEEHQNERAQEIPVSKKARLQQMQEEQRSFRDEMTEMRTSMKRQDERQEEQGLYSIHLHVEVSPNLYLKRLRVSHLKRRHVQTRDFFL